MHRVTASTEYRKVFVKRAGMATELNPLLLISDRHLVRVCCRWDSVVSLFSPHGLQTTCASAVQFSVPAVVIQTLPS